MLRHPLSSFVRRLSLSANPRLIWAAMAHTEAMRSFVRAVKDREHRLAPTTWVAGAAAIVYAVAPIDLIPELFFGPLGLADDVGVWGILAVLFAREHARWRAGLTAT